MFLSIFQINTLKSPNLVVCMCIVGKIYLTLKSLNASIYGEDIAKEYSVRGSCVGYPH